MEENIFECIEPYLMERAGRIYTKNTEYQEARKETDLFFERLNDSLNEEQSALLEQYRSANTAAVAVMEKLVYQQGMKDMLDLLLTLLKNCG